MCNVFGILLCVGTTFKHTSHTHNHEQQNRETEIVAYRDEMSKSPNIKKMIEVMRDQIKWAAYRKREPWLLLLPPPIHRIVGEISMTLSMSRTHLLVCLVVEISFCLQQNGFVMGMNVRPPTDMACHKRMADLSHSDKRTVLFRRANAVGIRRLSRSTYTEWKWFSHCSYTYSSHGSAFS